MTVVIVIIITTYRWQFKMYLLLPSIYVCMCACVCKSCEYLKTICIIIKKSNWRCMQRSGCAKRVNGVDFMSHSFWQYPNEPWQSQNNVNTNYNWAYNADWVTGIDNGNKCNMWMCQNNTKHSYLEFNYAHCICEIGSRWQFLGILSSVLAVSMDFGPNSKDK